MTNQLTESPGEVDSEAEAVPAIQFVGQSEPVENTGPDTASGDEFSDGEMPVEESFVALGDENRAAAEAADGHTAYGEPGMEDIVAVSSPVEDSEPEPAGESVCAIPEAMPEDKSVMEDGDAEAAAASMPHDEETKIPVREDSGEEPWLIDLSPADVEFSPPLVQCLAMLAKREGRPVSPNVIMAGLPSGPAANRPSVILRAAKAVGIDAAIASKPSLEQISHMTMPCILVLQNNGACILTSLDKDSAMVIFPEQGTAERRVLRSALEKEYIGYAVFVKITAELDARASKIKLVEHGRWFWGTLAGFLPRRNKEDRRK